MIHVSVGLSNPWGQPFDNLWNRSGLITNHKAWELELLQTRELIGFEFSYTRRQSHAGLTLELALLGRSLSFMIYDTRHWNHQTNAWEIHLWWIFGTPLNGLCTALLWVILHTLFGTCWQELSKKLK